VFDAGLKPKIQIRGGLKPMRAQRSSISVCKLRITGVGREIMIKLLAWPMGEFKKIIKGE
jgi:hypothetical protein